MPIRPAIGAATWRRLALKLFISAAALALVAGCSKSGSERLASKRNNPDAGAAQSRTAAGKAELKKATAYWAGEHQKDPKNPRAALAYAMNLKALGHKSEAMQVLKVAQGYHPSDARIASEYGRLALELNKVELADKLLAHAEQEADWKVLSAKGTIHAKKGEYGKAQKLFLAALEKRPNAPSILNNLALAYALDGKADQAEPLLRQAMSDGHETPRMRQNLSLVLGLQGKFSEAEQVAAVDLSGDQATSNVKYLRNMVRDEIKLAGSKARPAAPAASPPVTLANSTAASAAAAGLKRVAPPRAPKNSDWTATIIEPKPTAKKVSKKPTAKTPANSAPPTDLQFRR